jgi:hypothetical protein
MPDPRLDALIEKLRDEDWEVRLDHASTRRIQGRTRLMPAHTTNQWNLVDVRSPLDEDEDFTRIPMPSVDEFERHLRRVSEGKPGVIFLDNDSGASLRLGLSSELGFVECLIPGSTERGRFGLPSTSPASRAIEFFNQGVGEPVWPENLLPVDEVVRIALEFYETGELPKSVRWGKRVWKTSP